MPRRYKKTRLQAKPILLLLLVVNGVVGLVFSPLTSIRKVRVEGATREDQGRFFRAAQKLRGIPCARVNPRIVESLSLQNPEVRSATLSRSIFGSAVLHVGYRKAVARIFDRTQIGLTIDGVFFQSNRLPDDLPTLKLPDGEPRPSLTLATDRQYVALARLAAGARELSSKALLRIDVEPGGRVCLNINAGRVDFGSCENMNTKLNELNSYLQGHPSFERSSSTLNLTLPDHPAYMPEDLHPKQVP